MTPDDSEPNDRRDEPADENHWLSSLLSALEWLEDDSVSGRKRTDRTVLDYDISVRTGESLDDRTQFDRRSDTGDDRDRIDHDRPRTRRYRSSSTAPSDDHHLTTREADDEVLVTADVTGADPDDVTVGFDETMLVIAVSGREIDRVDVPWRDRTAEATIKNGILTVQVTPSEDVPEGDEEANAGPDTEDDR
ncbi:Hsp20/alpha crystallin family protein [Natronorubrum halophilum]|uniref:Hsp20/alpha crystallin family protein n=1 Tax=Natronorubrum halophilum TaxID=1702106 RepID=UPI0010C203AB|nr:Hsp20/alpha crystallin family protein [Natronorubrum halophilum]